MKNWKKLIQMNKLITALVFGFLAIMVSCNIQNTNDQTIVGEQKKSKIAFANNTINIGKFKSGSKEDVIFYARNMSDTPLIIDTLQASCSCTIGSFSKKPILKNDSSKIVVTFNPKTGVYGYFKKSVVVSANTKPTFSVLTIEGEIVP